MADQTKVLIPPNSKESEMMVLGSMLTSVNSLNAAADSLNASDFYHSEHQIIFDVLKAAYTNDKPADVHLVCEELKRQDRLKAVGGVAYVTSLAQYAGTSAFIEEYAEIVQNKAILRRMIHASHDIERSAAADPSDVHALLDEAQQKFFTISQASNSQGGVLVRDLLSGVKAAAKIPFLKELQQRQEEFQLKGPQEIAITGLPTHFIDLDKMINGLGNSNFILLAARPAMGKCVSGDTQILNPLTGALNSIKDFVAQKMDQILTLNKDWTLSTTSPSAFVADGIKPTFQVTTALGREIEATAVHPLLTIAGWKRVEELKVGDRIAVPRALPYFGSKKWAESKLIALAYFIADGCLTKANPSFTNTNIQIVKDFKNAISEFGPVRVREENDSHKAPSYYVSLDREPLQELKTKFATAINSLLTTRKKQLYQFVEHLGLNKTNVCAWANATAMPALSTCVVLEKEFPELPSFSEATRNNPVTEWLESLELMGKNAHQKTLPKDIFELTKPNISVLINRLFSCDGTAYVANCDGQPFPVIAYASTSKTLIYQIQHLLLRFGILSKIRKKNTTSSGKVFPSFELEIHGRDNLTLFCTEIGIFGKEEAVSKVLDHVLSTSPGWTKDTIPLEIWDLIRAKKGNRSWKSLFRTKGLPAPSNLHAGKRAPRRDTLAKLAYVLDDLELKQIAESDVYWDRITSIESTGQKEVFDLTVDQTHNFVAGDIIVHNTAFAVNIAENICFKSGLPVGIFSLEMTSEQLLHRLICSQAEVESDKLRNGNLTGAEFQRIVAAVSSMQKSTMIIDDQPGLKITDLRARARRMKETHGIRFLVIDYLQLISGSGVSKSAENRQNEISEISRMLKNLARELNVPIVCLSQLSRKVEERPGHRPMMSDLRESGSLEQDSDVVVFLLRREYYDPYDKPGQAEVIVAKNRHGGVGSVFLTFRKELAQFANYSGSLDAQPPNDEAFSAFTAR
ncbi:MAG: replicative DNA helicase [Rhabdochlamydiaceae bacterium]|nr:replicative DNA helicase [Rhabdochlamydiaceae bacterium]